MFLMSHLFGFGLHSLGSCMLPPSQRANVEFDLALVIKQQSWMLVVPPDDPESSVHVQNDL